MRRNYNVQYNYISIRVLQILLLCTASLLLVACSGGGSGGEPAKGSTGTSDTYIIGGTLSGLTSALVLKNNGTDTLSVSTNGKFTFVTGVADGGTYAIAIVTQPTGQTCTVTNGSGTVSGADVANVVINCVTNPGVTTYKIGGTVSGLLGAVMLRNNNTDDLSLSANGNFIFATGTGGNYTVTVAIQPVGQTCVVANGSGTASANITNVEVTCTTTTVVNKYTIGGTVSGLVGTVVLKNNNVDDLTLSSNGNFTFATAIENYYFVTVAVQPVGQTCSVTNGSGTVKNVNIRDVSVKCSSHYTVGGTIMGLIGTVVLQNNGSDNLSLSANDKFSFATPIVVGGAYNISVFTQPGSGQVCVVTGGTGTVTSETVTNIIVTCNAILSLNHAMAAGLNHTCALTAAGAALCWGANSYGQLGNGTNAPSSTPVPVTGLDSGVLALTAGRYHTCALTTAGAVKCWGYNIYGELGDDTTTNSSIPVSVTSLGTGAVALAAGDYHTCALTDAGAVKCWGWNSYGQLGNGNNVPSSIPVQVTGFESGVTSLTAGDYHTCALTNAGAVKCWGDNFYGELGDTTETNSNTPVGVSGLDSGVTALTAGGYHTCVLTDDGRGKCWGDNIYGELGDRTTTNSSVPVLVEDLGIGVVALAAGDYHTCALTNAWSVKCWGINYHGELGNGTTANSSVPVLVTGTGNNYSVAALTAGYKDTCALTAAGMVYCWGDNSYYQLGNGIIGYSNVPVRVQGY